MTIDAQFLATFAKTLDPEERTQFFLDLMSGDLDFAKFNDNHDDKGRFASGDGSGNALVIPENGWFSQHNSVSATYPHVGLSDKAKDIASRIGNVKTEVKNENGVKTTNSTATYMTKDGRIMNMTLVETNEGNQGNNSHLLEGNVSVEQDGNRANLTYHTLRDDFNPLSTPASLVARIGSSFSHTGLGTAMLEYARSVSEYPILHSTKLSTEGQAFASTTKGLFQKFNENHDEKGRFAPSDNSGSTAPADYRMQHQAPTRADDFGSPATNIEEMMPNFYDNPKMYGSSYDKADQESRNAIMAIKDKPDAQVTIYRAVPSDVKGINQGDWVTLSPTYANEHNQSNLNGEGHVISQTIPARDLWFDGDSVNEFGYDPQGNGAIAKALFLKYNPDQPRDPNGRFASGDGISSGQAGDLASQAMQGGFSYNPTTHAAPTTGYMVARVGATVDVPAGNLQEAKNGLKSFVDSHMAMFAADPNLHIGGWVADGRLYIEPSDNVQSLDHATSLGSARDQIAIWDVANGQEINTGGSGGQNAKAGSNDPNFGKALHGDSRKLGNDDGGSEGSVGGGFLGQVWDILSAREGVAETLGFVKEFNPEQARDDHGRWTSDGSSSSGATAGSLAKGVYDRAKALEPSLTKTMQGLADKHGATLAGLKYAVKEQGSLTNKIQDVADKQYHGDVQEAAQHISDANRYTMLADPSTYIDTARQVTQDLQQQGFDARVKNYWTDGSNYKGINVALTDPQGNQIELQFHTPESLAVKEGDNHPIYKEYSLMTEAQQATPYGKDLNQQMVNNVANLVTPANVQSFGTLKIGKSLFNIDIHATLNLGGRK